MANLTNEKVEFAIAIFRHFSPLFAIFRHWPPPVYTLLVFRKLVYRLLFFQEASLYITCFQEASLTDVAAPGEADLSAMTSGERSKWASFRETFFSKGANKHSLNLIEQVS